MNNHDSASARMAGINNDDYNDNNNDADNGSKDNDGNEENYLNQWPQERRHHNAVHNKQMDNKR